MVILVKLDTMLSQRKQGKVKAVRFETPMKRCEFLDGQPGDLLVHEAASG